MANTLKLTQTADSLTSDKISFDITATLEQNTAGDAVTQFSGIRRFELAASGTDAATLVAQFANSLNKTTYLYIKNATSGNSAEVLITLTCASQEIACLKEGDFLWLPMRSYNLNSTITLTNVAAGSDAGLIELAYYY